MSKGTISSGLMSALTRRRRPPEEKIDPNEMPRRFDNELKALKWALEYLDKCYGMSRPNMLYTPPRYRETPSSTVTREELQDLAYTITGTLRQGRPKPATILGVLCGDDDGERWNGALDIIASEIRGSLKTSLTRPQLRMLAAVAMNRIRAEVLKKPRVPRCRYAESVGVKRQSADEPKWRDAINAIEDLVREWRKQGRHDLRAALEEKGIV